MPLKSCGVRSISNGLLPLFGLIVWLAAPDQFPVKVNNATESPPVRISPTEQAIVDGRPFASPLQSRTPMNRVDSSARYASPVENGPVAGRCFATSLAVLNTSSPSGNTQA